MKIVVINFSGNVGKSTIAAHLLKPRLNDAKIFSIETLNTDSSKDGVDVENYKGKQFNTLMEEIILERDCIIDVGASNAEDFCQLRLQHKGSSKKFDCFVVPAVIEKKQIYDTLKTIDTLAEMGVPKKRIKVIFNKLAPDDSVEQEFWMIFAGEDTKKNFTLNPEWSLVHNEAFENCKELGMPLAKILADKTDYQALGLAAKKAGNEAEARRLIKLCLLKMTAISAAENMDQVFNGMFGQKNEDIPL
ncbi:MAG: StbB family protein [Methylobacter sp.]|nr:StbB family protein [Methylobacter sp.]